VLGLSAKLGVKEPISFKSPDIYRQLFWGGLWGIPFGLLIDAAWTHLYLFGFLYFLVPVLALFLRQVSRGSAPRVRAEKREGRRNRAAGVSRALLRMRQQTVVSSRITVVADCMKK
jgi:hypothetical protein